MKACKKKINYLVALILTVSATTCFAANVRHVIWDKTFIPIEVPIGQEKIIEVCAQNSQPDVCDAIPLTPYLPRDEIMNGSLKWINNGGTLYLNATKPFANKLAELKLNNQTGQIIIVQLSATQTANNDRIVILLPNKSTTDATNHTTEQISEDKSIGDMVRWVAQQLYAPTRLLTQPNWIYRTPMHTNRFVDLYRGGVVSAMPLASYRAGDYYVTAVLLRNVSEKQQVHLTHKMLRGSWIASSFFRQSNLDPATLTPARTDQDSTTAILVSSAPFVAALREGE